MVHQERSTNISSNNKINSEHNVEEVEQTRYKTKSPSHYIEPRGTNTTPHNNTYKESTPN